jgi:hypothetical protein
MPEAAIGLRLEIELDVDRVDLAGRGSWSRSWPLMRMVRRERDS